VAEQEKRKEEVKKRKDVDEGKSDILDRFKRRKV